MILVEVQKIRMQNCIEKTLLMSCIWKQGLYWTFLLESIDGNISYSNYNGHLRVCCGNRSYLDHIYHLKFPITVIFILHITAERGKSKGIV